MAPDSPSSSGVFWEPAFCPFPGLQHQDVVLSLCLMTLRPEIPREMSQGYEPMQIKNEKVVFCMLTPIMVIHNADDL